jgi:hypothetical protein
MTERAPFDLVDHRHLAGCIYQTVDELGRIVADTQLRGCRGIGAALPAIRTQEQGEPYENKRSHPGQR